MTVKIRPALGSDLDAMARLMLSDARARASVDPLLWALAVDPGEQIRTSLDAAMHDTAPLFRRKWLIAEAQGRMVGVTHAILLPVPPIYAGAFGPPGLIMEDCALASDAPPETGRICLEAAENDLKAAGAKILLGSSVAGGRWGALYLNQGYVPLTQYYAKTELTRVDPGAGIRLAIAQDVPDIVRCSAAHRRILHELNPVFWKPHDAADDRFGAWMHRSLTLTDRDMFVSHADTSLRGYAIAQPASTLHVPVAHDVAQVGFVDDYHHCAFADVFGRAEGQRAATGLLAAAEAARARRGNSAVLVVCPADWTSKNRLLSDAGYRVAITWYVKQVS